jgi:hypothetical protein
MLVVGRKFRISLSYDVSTGVGKTTAKIERLTRESDVSKFRPESGYVVGKREVTYLGHDEVSPRKPW